MKKKIILIYICAGVAVFLILFSLFGFTAYRDYVNSSARGNNMFSQVEKTVRATYLIDDKFSPSFRKNIKAFINFDSRLAAVMVKDYSGNPIYCYSRFPSKVNFKEASLSADRYYSMYQGPVNVTGSPALKLEILYKTLDRDRLFYMIKSLIVYILVLIIITTALFVLFSDEFIRKFSRLMPDAPKKKKKVLDEPKKKTSVTDYGFAESKYFEMTLTDTLSEASSLDRDLVLAEVQFSKKADMELWQIAGESIKNLFSSTELVFAGSKDRFHIIFPDRTLKEALRLTRNLFQDISLRTGNEVMLYAGLTSRNGRLLSPGRLLSEADTALSKADDEENIVALETDPDRYREYINSNC